MNAVNEFLNSLKADLLDRRLLPLVALVGVIVIAAVAYAVMGGGSVASTTPAPVSASVSTPASGISVSATTAEKAVAETTDGTGEQRKGHARNPFEPIAGATSTSTTASTTTSSAASTGSSSTSSSSSTTTTSTTTTTKHEQKVNKAGAKKTVYHVAIEFGVFPAGASVETVVLTPYENLKLKTPLPSVKQPLIVYRGVTSGGKSATFSIVGEAILHGIGNCLPSATQCQALDLKPGQSEQLEYLPAGGETITYELRVVSIAASQESSQALVASARNESKAGAEVLRRAGLTTLPVLRESSQPGVLVFPVRRASAARARTAVIRHLQSH